MPTISRDMSWLSPRRRRTTGNLRSIPNGQLTAESTGAVSPGSPTLERPAAAHRPLSQPAVSAEADANLFYAYARKGDDIHSRYLLTFASASVANEWWLLLQIHFPDCTRPGPQLFSFKTDDLLTKAWKHASFAHLKSKWMYISFSDTSTDGIGGAAQGIIPVQDAAGNMLGGTASNADELLPEAIGEAKEAKVETKQVRKDVGRLEGYFDKMMQALERNTQKVAELATATQVDTVEPASEDGEKAKQVDGMAGYFALDALSSHFSRMNELLTQNSQHVESLANKNEENERELRKTVDSLATKRDSDALDLQKLSSHLDRIQSIMEESVQNRNDSAKDLSEPTAQIDFSPLTQRLEKVQEAVEQNSALIKSLLDDRAAKPEVKDEAPQMDLSPLQDHLRQIHTALEQQNEHTKALVGFASGEGEDGDSGAAVQDRNLAPLGEHLEQIYSAIVEGNKHAKETPQKLDLEPLGERFDQIHSSLEEGNKHARELPKFDLTPLDEHFNRMHRSIEEANSHNREAIQNFDLRPLRERLDQIHTCMEEGNKIAREAPNLDLGPLSERLDHIHSSIEEYRKENAESLQKFDLGPLERHLEAIHEHAQKNSENAEKALEAQNSTREALEAKGDEHLEAMREHRQKSSEESERLLKAHNATRDAVAANGREHLDAMRDHLQKSNESLEKLLEAQTGIRQAVEANGGELDFTPLADHMEAIRESSDNNNEYMKRLLDLQSDSNTRSIDLTPLTGHLEAIRKANEQNTEHVRSLIESQQASAIKTSESSGVDFTPLTDRLNRIHSTLEKQSEQREQSPGTGDSKFLMNALSSHLSKIQKVSEQNGAHIKFLREKQASSDTKMQGAVSETSEQVKSLVERNKENEARIESQNSQMRELMSGQREMVEVMRQLARSLVEQNKGACDHVVVPPPRKMGRKVVGFVYDAKDGLS